MTIETVHQDGPGMEISDQAVDPVPITHEMDIRICSVWSRRSLFTKGMILLRSSQFLQFLENQYPKSPNRGKQDLTGITKDCASDE